MKAIMEERDRKEGLQNRKEGGSEGRKKGRQRTEKRK